MKVFLDIQIERTPVGRLICELRDDVCPKTSENFRRLCKGERVMMMSGFGHELRTYKNSVAHRIIPKFMCQMGDYENNDGTGGKSVYGEKFADENFVLKHSERGVLSMANSGKDTNGSQFFVCLEKCPWLDGKHCAFGKVVSGMDVLEKIEMCGSKTGKVSKAVKIIDCGEIDEELEFGVLGKTREASERV
jgi:peptidyl-prolyl isomerase E (cyclophilin E)